VDEGNFPKWNVMAGGLDESEDDAVCLLVGFSPFGSHLVKRGFGGGK
jgi:hypothetical protein